MKNEDLTDAAIERSQAFLGAVLGADEDGNLPDNPRIEIGGNNPPEPIIAPEDAEVAKLVGNAAEWSKLHPVISTEEVAKAAADWIKQLKDHLDEYKEKFRKEKEPHETELKKVRTKWHPRIDRLEICLRAITSLHRAYLARETARLKAERQAAERAAAEERQRAEQLAEQAKAGAPETMIAAAEAAKRADEARKAAAAAPVRAHVVGNLGGRTHSLRSVWRAEVVQQDLLYAYLRNDRDVMALFYSKANALVRAKDGPRPDGGLKAGPSAALPGCYVYHSEE
jgi:hypothetical protein